SRAVIRRSASGPGDRPMVPMNGAPRIRTPGRPSEGAKPSANAQRTMNGSLDTSHRNPTPGTWTLYPSASGPPSTCSSSTRRSAIYRYPFALQMESIFERQQYTHISLWHCLPSQDHRHILTLKLATLDRYGYRTYVR